LLSSAGTNQDSPPFPTRRSSDLEDCKAPGSRTKTAKSFGAARHAERRHFIGTDSLSPLLVLGSCSVLRGVCRAIVLLAVLHRRQDRKSTRLNSSHVAISYAVFCL